MSFARQPRIRVLVLRKSFATSLRDWSRLPSPAGDIDYRGVQDISGSSTHAGEITSADSRGAAHVVITYAASFADMAACMCALALRWDETMRFAIWTIAVILLAAEVAGVASPVQANEAAAPAPPDEARESLVFRGTVTTLQPAPVPASNADWIVTLHVEQVLAGKFSGSEFSFRVHSPAQSGLRPGETYTVRATAMGDGGYRVDPLQWLDVAPERRAILATPTGKVSITAVDLEQIREVAADLLQTSTNPNYGKEWADDLRASDGGVDSTGVARIGRWILESRHKRLVLVRHPARSAIMHFVLIDIELKDGRWQATGMGDERMELLRPSRDP